MIIIESRAIRENDLYFAKRLLTFGRCSHFLGQEERQHALLVSPSSYIIRTKLATGGMWCDYILIRCAQIGTVMWYLRGSEALFIFLIACAR